MTPDLPGLPPGHAQDAEDTPLAYLTGPAPPDAGLERRVLVVEDVAPQRLYLMLMLQKLGYQVEGAGNGEEALAMLEARPAGIVISDWRMPRMDGLALLTALKAHPEAPYFLMLTGEQEASEMVAALDAGADDFLQKPFNAEELRARVQAGARLVALRETLASQHQDLRRVLASERHLLATLRTDLEAAGRLQRSLLPAPSSSDTPGPLQLFHHFQPAAMVAGDAYGVIPLDKRWTAFYLIDVVGHGARAAMLSFAISRCLGDAQANGLHLMRRSSLQQELTPRAPEQVVAELNRRFQDERDEGQYFTMIYGILNLESGEGRLSQAGHPAPRLYAEGKAPQKLGNGGPPVGILPGARYTGLDFKMQHNGCLLLHSDGIDPLHDASTSLPWTPLLASDKDSPALLRGLTHDPLDGRALCQSLVSRIDHCLRGREAEDDISLMILQWRAPSHWVSVS
ncbi:PP2C family protein-serine/threonine phosphatase [Onishia taeanensis]